MSSHETHDTPSKWPRPPFRSDMQYVPPVYARRAAHDRSCKFRTDPQKTKGNLGSRAERKTANSGVFLGFFVIYFLTNKNMLKF